MPLSNEIFKTKEKTWGEGVPLSFCMEKSQKTNSASLCLFTWKANLDTRGSLMDLNYGLFKKPGFV